MENKELKELKELKRGFDYEIKKLSDDYRKFRRRVCILANIFMPGVGFFLHGSHYRKGWISLILYLGYTGWFLNLIKYEIRSDLLNGHFQISAIIVMALYYMPAIIINIISTTMIANIEE